MSKLVGDVSLMGGQMRKMQKGIDAANQNFIQQLQSLINDIFVLFGGGGDTGLDFGDLKYLFQAIGALFGFDEGIFPINLFNAAWHFFSNFILPGGSFEEVINALVDNFIASVLDLFGEVPILGEALQQFAVIISEIRDLVMPIFEALSELFGAFDLELDDSEGIGGFFGPLGPIVDVIWELLEEIDLPDISSAIAEIIRLGAPVIKLIAGVIKLVALFIKIIFGTATIDQFFTAIQELVQGIIPGAGNLGFGDIGSTIIGMFLNPTSFIQNILSMLGLGGSPPTTPGSGGGGTTNPDGSGTVIPGNFDPFSAIMEFINQLFGGGVLTGQQPVPPPVLAPLAPGAEPNVMPTPAFPNTDSVDGHGLWLWDWPDEDAAIWDIDPGCIRTRRTETVTIYWVSGTWQNLPGDTPHGDPKEYIKNLFSDQTVNLLPDGTGQMVPGEQILDWSRFEVISVPYPGAMYPLGWSANQAIAWLKKTIRLIPGDFMLLGGSQGGFVISAILDDLRYGSLQDRYENLLFGCAMGSMRRQRGRGFPDQPERFDNNKYGCYLPTLQDTPDHWWEFGLEGGTYPAYDNLNGVTYGNDDPISCRGDDSVSQQMRDLVRQTADVKTYTANSQSEFYLLMIGSAIFTGEAFNNILAAGQPSIATPHAFSPWQVQPFLAEGDHRTFWHYMIDHMNSLVADRDPSLGEIRQFESVQQQSVQPGEHVTAFADVQWMNMPEINGPAIMLCVNVYNGSGVLINTMINDDCIIYDPEEDRDWDQIYGVFEMPIGASFAKPMVHVFDDAMTTAIVWARRVGMQVEKRLDAATIGNIENIPVVPASNLGGVQGIFSLENTLQTIIDGGTNANTPEDVDLISGGTLAQMFEYMARTRQDSTLALSLVTALLQSGTPSFHTPETYLFEVPGEHIFTIPAWAQVVGTKFDLIGVGAGGAGDAIVWFFIPPGGGAGTWAHTTVTYGTEIPNGATQFKIVVGDGGIGGLGGGQGTDGEDLIMKLMSNTILLAAAGGLGGVTDAGVGEGAGDIVFNNQPYFASKDVNINQPGQPRGGGSGTNTTGAGPYNGGTAVGWVRIWQP
jgi:hypothetical protein